MVEQVTADFNQQVITAKGLTVQQHGAWYRSDSKVYVMLNEQFKSYIKAEFNLNAIPRSAEVVLTHLQSLHEGSAFAPVNISVNGLVINDNFLPTGSANFSTDAIPLIPSEHLKVGSNYVAVSSGKDMRTQYWIKSLQINLKSEKYIEGQADFSQHSISHTGDINSVTTNDRCNYRSSGNVWTMDIDGQINISFNVASLTNLVPPSVQVTLEWLSSRLHSEPGYSPADLLINGTTFQSKITDPTGGFNYHADTFDVPTMHMKVGINVLQISTPYQDMKSLLWLKNVYVNGNRQGYLQYQFRVAVEEATPGLLELDYVLDVAPSLTIGDDGTMSKIVLIYTTEQVSNLPATVAGAPVRQIVSKVSSTNRAITAEALPPLPVLQGSLTIGPVEWLKGTLGAVMFTSNANRTPNLITAAHVAKIQDSKGKSTDAEILYAPNTTLSGRNTAGKNPVFADKDKLNLDAAAYYLNQDRDYKEGVEGICNSISGMLAPYENMRVIKNGAVTGITRGRVKSVTPKLVIIVPLPGEESTYISKNGDSGAVWLAEVNGKHYAVALLQSGKSDGPTEKGNYSVGIKMNKVINALSSRGRPLTFMKQIIHDEL